MCLSRCIKVLPIFMIASLVCLLFIAEAYNRKPNKGHHRKATKAYNGKTEKYNKEIAEEHYRKKCHKQMIQDGIVPYFILNSFPVVIVTAEFDNNEQEQVLCGNIFNVTSMRKAPFVKVSSKVRCKYLTVIIVDVDNLDGAPFLHLLIHDIPADDLEKGIDTGHDFNGTAAPYMKPAPKGSDSYRILILAYCQDSVLKAPKGTFSTYESRLKFDLTKESKKYDFGMPVGVNFCYLSYEWTEPLP
ncbi:uncharacterized protein LOC129217586 isoform X1 [Uloborus diversus]|uniref:uncharacterized protein LOC129217586 isoform X1 n=1 Tax=Uloborus diversus TaxID=327109 RepID=UPI00240A3CD6|nr:uncharacterized protein LOC129217586 isoform X1 [Uloborus diversus]